MKINLVIGSRADSPGIVEIARALRDLNVSRIVLHIVGPAVGLDKAGWIKRVAEDAYIGLVSVEYEPCQCDAVVVLGDRYEIVQAALEYREMGIPIAHIHAGELAGQEPDDAYRNVISAVSEWLFMPHERWVIAFGCHKAGSGEIIHRATKCFSCGSPFITSAANTELVDVEWPGCYGPKVFLAFNPLPEDLDATKALDKCIESVWKAEQRRCVMISPNTDRNAGSLEPWYHDVLLHNSLTHAEYLSYMATADVIIGNTSAGLIEGSYYGVPYICVGSRQKYRVAGEHVIRCEPHEIQDKIPEALAMEKRPNGSYGGADSAMRIAETLIDEVGKDR